MNTLTDADWSRELARARATENDVSRQIREKVAMSKHEQWCARLIASWCRDRAREERSAVKRFRTAYKDPTLAALVSRYADAREAAARLFEDLEVAIKREAEKKEAAK